MTSAAASIPHGPPAFDPAAFVAACAPLVGLTVPEGSAAELETHLAILAGHAARVMAFMPPAGEPAA